MPTVNQTGSLDLRYNFLFRGLYLCWNTGKKFPQI